MGDWPSGAAIIHACPPYRVRPVLDILAEYGLADEDTTNGATLTVGEWYSADEFRCGHANDVAGELVERAPEVAFTVYEEPAYGWVGTICTYVPELGLFTADCDNSGEVLFTRKQVLALDGKPDDIRQKELGVPWVTAIARMPAGTVIEPRRFATHWDRRHGEVVVVEGKQRGDDLIFPAPVTAAQVDAALIERGFRRADDWTQLDDTAQLWRTDSYHYSPS